MKVLTDEDLVTGPPVPPAQVHDRPYDAIEALNWSTLKHLAISPRMLRWRVDHPQPDSRAMQLGRAIHCAVLEPERWASAYTVKPACDRRTKIGKAAYAEWLDSLDPGVEVLDAADHEIAERCAVAVRTHSVAAALLRGGRTEEIVTWTDPELGVACKARLDLIAPMYVLDLKSTRSETLPAMGGETARRLYHGQLAYYHDGAIAAGLVPREAELPRVLYVQTVDPFDVVPGRLMREDIEDGRSLYRGFLRKYLECQAADWWPGLAPEEVDLLLPAWTPRGDENAETEAW